MPQTPHDRESEPSLDLPSFTLPGLRRRGKKKQLESTTETVPPGDPESTEARESAQPARKADGRRDEGADLAVPASSGWLAAAVTGAIVGVGGTAATVGALAGCEAVRGVSTCGGAPGFFLLVAILALMVLLGALLLKVLRVKAPGSTSFLAVGVVAVVAMLLLLDAIYSPWMFVVIPALGAASYLTAHWVTTRFDEDDTGRRDWR